MSVEMHTQSLTIGLSSVGKGYSNLDGSPGIGEPGRDTPGLIRSSGLWLQNAVPDVEAFRSTNMSIERVDESDESERLLDGRFGMLCCCINEEVFPDAREVKLSGEANRR